MSLVKGLIEGIRSGKHSSIARALTLIEDHHPQREELLSALGGLPRLGPVIGITGPMGVGKSTLAGELLAEADRRGVSVGVLAVDPTSHLSGGAFLGDRLRMSSPAFIRSMAHRGGRGGVAESLPEALEVMTRAFRLTLVETLGAGQDEVAIDQLADRVVVLVSHATGDAVQIMKGGLMEIAHLIVVTRADEPESSSTLARIRDVARLLPRSPEVMPFDRGDSETAAALLDEMTAVALREPDKNSAALDPVLEKGLVLDHIAVAVDDMDEAEGLWTALLGPPETSREEIPDQKVIASFFPDPSGVSIELLSDPAGDGPVGRFLEKRGPGLHHLCFSVPDLDAAVKKLEKAGLSLASGPAYTDRGQRVAFIHPRSTKGVLVEIVQGGHGSSA